MVHLLKTAQCEPSKRHTGQSSASSWLQWWAKEKNVKVPKRCCAYLRKGKGHARCRNPAQDGAHVKCGGKAWILPTCHACNMSGFSNAAAAHCSANHLARLTCKCPYQRARQMRMATPAFQTPAMHPTERQRRLAAAKQKSAKKKAATRGKRAYTSVR